MKTIAQKEERRQPKIKMEMRGKELTVPAGLGYKLFRKPREFYKDICESVLGVKPYARGGHNASCSRRERDHPDTATCEKDRFLMPG